MSGISQLRDSGRDGASFVNAGAVQSPGGRFAGILNERDAMLARYSSTPKSRSATTEETIERLIASRLRIGTVEEQSNGRQPIQQDWQEALKHVIGRIERTSKILKVSDVATR